MASILQCVFPISYHRNPQPGFSSHFLVTWFHSPGALKGIVSCPNSVQTVQPAVDETIQMDGRSQFPPHTVLELSRGLATDEYSELFFPFIPNSFKNINSKIISFALLFFQQVWCMLVTEEWYTPQR